MSCHGGAVAIGRRISGRSLRLSWHPFCGPDPPVTPLLHNPRGSPASTGRCGHRRRFRAMSARARKRNFTGRDRPKPSDQSLVSHVCDPCWCAAA
jgi:hypothetical protein